MRPALEARIANRARAALVPVLLSLSILTGCSRGGGHASLQGHAPGSSARVGAITLPEVHTDRGESPFHLVPASGRLLVVYFGYTTCPDVCPTTLSDLHRALAMLGDDARRVEVAFVTVDRVRDTPDLLAPYITSFVAGGHALRPASQSELASAERVFGATSSVERNADGAVEVTHTGSMYVVEPSGRIVDELPFGSSAEVMAHDLRVLLPPAAH